MNVDTETRQQLRGAAHDTAGIACLAGIVWQSTTPIVAAVACLVAFTYLAVTGGVA